MAQKTPHRFKSRVSSGLPRRLGRVVEGAVDSDRVYGEGLEVQPDGRLDLRVAKGSVLRMTRRGLDIDRENLGEKNRPQLDRIADVPTGSSTADLLAAFNTLLAELRRTKNMRGGF